MKEAKRRNTAFLVTVVLVTAGVAIGTSLVPRNDSTSTSQKPSRYVTETTNTLRNKPDGVGLGSTRQGTGSGADVRQLQGDAESAAGAVSSGDGLRVENKTGGQIVLVFPNGDTAWVAAGKSMVVQRPCRDIWPLRAERKSGELVAERDGPCRRRDTWTLGID